VYLSIKADDVIAKVGSKKKGVRKTKKKKMSFAAAKPQHNPPHEGAKNEKEY